MTLLAHPQLQPLEPRRLFALTFAIDYTYDTNGFFNNQAARQALEFAANLVSSKLNDTFDAITPANGSYSIVITNPATGTQASIPSLVLPANTIPLFVGGRVFTDGAIGRGGPAGFTASGSNAFFTLIQSRGEAGAQLPEDQRTDIAPLAAHLAFDTDTNWSFDINNAPTSNTQNDFLSVAVHELCHALGIGTAPSWENLINQTNSTFTGPKATNVFGAPIPVESDANHFAQTVTVPGQGQPAMSPALQRGTRKLLTNLDLAALDDIGYDVTGFTDPTSPPPTSPPPTSPPPTSPPPPPPSAAPTIATPTTPPKLSTTIGAKNTLKFQTLSTTSFAGSANITLVLSTDTTASNDDTTLGSLTNKKLNLKPDKPANLSLSAPTPSVPTTGTYFLLATLTASGTSTTTSLGSYSLQQATPDLSITLVPPKAISTTKPTSLSFQIKNTGNLSLTQPVTLELFAPENLTSPIATITKSLKLTPAKFSTLKLKALLAAGVTYTAKITTTPDTDATNNAATLTT